MKRVGRIVVSTLVIAMAGCGSFPQAGQVHAANPALPQTAVIAQQAAGPQIEADPRQIVDGFLRACAAGYDDDFKTAHLFLTGGASAAWKPSTAQVLVYPADSSPTLTISREEAGSSTVVVELTTELVGMVDQRGVFSASPQRVPLQVSFAVARGANGQWRISELENTVLLSASAFQTAFAERSLAFLTPDRKSIVQDVRYYPRRRHATHAISGLLGGPTEWLAPSVATAVPAGAKLQLQSVDVTNGEAKVEIAAEASVLSASDRALLYTQVQQTLAGLPSVSSVALTVNGAEISTQPVALTAVRQMGVLVALRMGQIVKRNGDRFEAIPGANNYENIHYPTYFGDGIVFLVGNKLVSLDSAGQGRDLAEQATLPPSVDRYKWVWAIAPSAEGVVPVVNQEGEKAAVTAPWLAGSQVRSLEVSAEGSRVAVVRTVGSTTHVEVAAIERDAQGVPRALGQPIVLGEYEVPVHDIAWYSGTELVVLYDEGADAAIHTYTIGGLRSATRAKEGAVEIAVSPERSLYVITDKGEMYERRGGVWRLTTVALKELSFGR